MRNFNLAHTFFVFGSGRDYQLGLLQTFLTRKVKGPDRPDQKLVELVLDYQGAYDCLKQAAIVGGFQKESPESSVNRLIGSALAGIVSPGQLDENAGVAAIRLRNTLTALADSPAKYLEDESISSKPARIADSKERAADILKLASALEEVFELEKLPPKGRSI